MQYQRSEFLVKNRKENNKMKLKKLISVFLLVTVLFSSLITVSAAEQHRVTDDFESYSQKTNETINGVTKWSSASAIVNENGNKSAVIGNNNGDTLYATTSGFSSDVTGVVANFSIKFNNNVELTTIFGVAGSNLPLAPVYRLLEFCGGGSGLLKVANNQFIPISYTTGKWYHVKVMLNYDTGYYHLSINDGTSTQTWSTQSSGLAYADFSPLDLSKLDYKFYTFWINGNTTQSVQIDNVDIYGVTDNRIYPYTSESENFSGFTSTNGTTVPAGFAAEGATGGDNGFVSSDGKLNLVSKSDASLSLTKTSDNELSPGNVKLKLSSAASPEFKIKVKDADGTEEVVDVSSDGLSGGGENANINVGAGTISLSIKDGKLYAAFNDGLSFAAFDFDTTLTGIKSFSIESAEGEVTDIMLSQIDYGTVKYFEETLNSVSSAKVLPNTDKITLNFSNKLMPAQDGAFSIIGDREIENVVISDGTAIITLDDELTPDCNYSLVYNNLYSIDVIPLSGTINFETDISLDAGNFDIESSSDAYSLSLNLKSNTGENQNMLILLTVYDNNTGKIISMDFEKVTATASQTPCTLSVPKPSAGSHSVEAYIWDGLNTMNSLGYTDILLGGVSE